ncbi:hypothetical protein BDF21DRAFT_407849 [Thamnidium elegans]|uniref:Uncharacterized protein n=1 Tax=Thamnidium elegans TaxID=101142 RepID=A0A8H7SUU8_9FUNG|nr:hypothetical protein INT48_006728 [Thamnidium elegans]KAI8094044.1 hypothetical protein BDF21DRAFT_407849 [Thamnidium elegans]
MLYSPTVRKKLDASTVTKSRPTNRPTLDTFSTHQKSDDRTHKSLLYNKKPTRLAKPSKSETTTSSLPIAFTRTSSSSQPLHTRRSVSNESTIIKTAYKNRQDIVVEEEEEEEELATRLKSTFIDVIESCTDNEQNDLVDMVRSQLDAQTVRIRRLERALKEKEDQLIRDDNHDTVSLLLKRYPQSMQLYKKQIEQDQFNQQLETCIDQFESQKQRMMEEHQRNFQILKSKYRSRFDDIVERMISDPSRLDDEWARRVKKDADDKVEEMKKFLYKKR